MKVKHSKLGSFEVWFNSWWLLMSQVTFLRFRIFLPSEPFCSSWICCMPLTKKTKKQTKKTSQALKGTGFCLRFCWISTLLLLRLSIEKATWYEAIRAAYQSEENNTWLLIGSVWARWHLLGFPWVKSD